MVMVGHLVGNATIGVERYITTNVIPYPPPHHPRRMALKVPAIIHLIRILSENTFLWKIVKLDFVHRLRRKPHPF